MGQDIVNWLLSAVRDAIARLETFASDPRERVMLQRALAHLWSAHDELDALSTRRPGRRR
jgi:hypothetical protein